MALTLYLCFVPGQAFQKRYIFNKKYQAPTPTLTQLPGHQEASFWFATLLEYLYKKCGHVMFQHHHIFVV